jgi:hypothetical protein
VQAASLFHKIGISLIEIKFVMLVTFKARTVFNLHFKQSKRDYFSACFVIGYPRERVGGSLHTTRPH